MSIGGVGRVEEEEVDTEGRGGRGRGGKDGRGKSTLYKQSPKQKLSSLDAKGDP